MKFYLNKIARNKLILKKLFFCLIIVFSLSSYSQKDNKNFQIGVQFNPTIKKNYFFKGIAGINVRYNFLETQAVAFDIGLNSFIMNSRDENLKNIIIINPNLVAAFKINNSGFRPYISIGYDFYTLKIKYSQLTLIQNPNANIDQNKMNFDGFNLNPGIRYFFKNNIFVDANYNFIKTKSDFDKNFDFHLLGVGLGLKF